MYSSCEDLGSRKRCRGQSNSEFFSFEEIGTKCHGCHACTPRLISWRWFGSRVKDLCQLKPQELAPIGIKSFARGTPESGSAPLVRSQCVSSSKRWTNFWIRVSHFVVCLSIYWTSVTHENVPLSLPKHIPSSALTFLTTSPHLNPDARLHFAWQIFESAVNWIPPSAIFYNWIWHFAHGRFWIIFQSRFTSVNWWHFALHHFYRKAKQDWKTFPCKAQLSNQQAPCTIHIACVLSVKHFTVCLRL